MTNLSGVTLARLIRRVADSRDRLELTALAAEIQTAYAADEATAVLLRIVRNKIAVIAATN